MASAFKRSLEELIHDFLCHLIVDEASWHYQYVCIVVLANHVSNLWNPSQSGTNALMLVERHSDTLARTTDTDTRINFAILNALGQSMTEVWVVDRSVTG